MAETFTTSLGELVRVEESEQLPPFFRPVWKLTLGSNRELRLYRTLIEDGWVLSHHIVPDSHSFVEETPEEVISVFERQLELYNQQGTRDQIETSIGAFDQIGESQWLLRRNGVEALLGLVHHLVALEWYWTLRFNGMPRGTPLMSGLTPEEAIVKATQHITSCAKMVDNWNVITRTVSVPIEGPSWYDRLIQ